VFHLPALRVGWSILRASKNIILHFETLREVDLLLHRTVIIRTLIAALLCAVTSLNALSYEEWRSDRDSANRIWGNPQNWMQSPHPDANYFAKAVPIGMGARPLGMGEAFTALADEISAIWWNPAGLIQLKTNEITWMGGDRLLNDVPYSGFIAANYILDNHMVFAFSYQRPYHPVGRYPELLGGGYSFSGWTIPNQEVGIPGYPGSKAPWTGIVDTQTQDFLAGAYRSYINPAFQENIYALSYATPLSADEALSFGINVKYMVNDRNYQFDGRMLNDVKGWGADLGFLYRLPLARFGRELAFGINLHDVASQVKYDNSREFTLPVISTLGVAWKTTDFMTRNKLNLTTDFVYINDPELTFEHNHRLNLGGEMWFFNDHIAPRMGYTIFFDQPSRSTLGLSFKYMVGVDYAYFFPAQNEKEGSHWFSVTIHWGGPKRPKPLPDVSCTVDPPIFSPKSGELATFTLAAEAKTGIDRWTLNIIDRNNQVVKSYSDRGTPPAQILWGGEDKTYRALPDGEYTFLFTATDNDGSSSSTPVQTLKIHTPPVVERTQNDVDQLRRLLKRQNDAEEAIDQKLKADVTKSLGALINAKAINTTLPDLVKAPEVPQSLTSGAQVPGAPGSSVPAGFMFPSVNDIPMPRTSVVTDPNGRKSFVVEYSTLQGMPRYILNDAADVVRVAARDLGSSVATYDVRATYGNRVMRVIAPSETALNYSRGFIKAEQLLSASVVTLDGDAITPLYR
jgi:hypothetical protein